MSQSGQQQSNWPCSKHGTKQGRCQHCDLCKGCRSECSEYLHGGFGRDNAAYKRRVNEYQAKALRTERETWEANSSSVQPPRKRYSQSYNEEELDSEARLAQETLEQQDCQRRVMVSFRGTSSSKNVWQDLDSKQIAHPGTAHVEPLLVHPEGPIARSTAQAQPRVHRGFYHAYKSTEQQVMAVVSALIESRPNGCVVFACGHSLL